ncbi:MAG: TonB-dependent receptor, partial [Acidobacteriota bacterium]
TENAGESEIYGFEIDFTYRPLQSWDLYGSVGFAHTEFTEFESATQGDLAGNRFGGAPEWTAALGANYRFNDGWFVHGDISYQGSAFATVENDPTLMLDSRTVINLRGGYETARYSILGFLDNATDEIYAVTAFRNIDGRRLGKVGTPRQAGLQLILRF